MSTFGASRLARSGRGHAGLDSSAVRPITPGNAVPGSYSVSPIDRSSIHYAETQTTPAAGILTPVLTSHRPFHAARPGEASCQRYEAARPGAYRPRSCDHETAASRSPLALRIVLREDRGQAGIWTSPRSG